MIVPGRTYNTEATWRCMVSDSSGMIAYTSNIHVSFYQEWGD